MNSKKLIAKSVAVAVFGLLSTSAFAAFQPFSVDEGTVPGTPANSFTADKINGSYSEIFTATSSSTFSAETVFDAGSYTLGGVTASSYMNGPGATGYKLYAIVDSSGTYSTVGTVTTFNGTSNTIKFWLDPSSDTTKTLTSGTVPPTVGNNADDILIASAAVGTGHGSDDSASSAPGNFVLKWSDFTLTNPQGMAYWPAPKPFYLDFQTNGNFNPFSVAVGQNISVTGVANGFYNVPEPESIALLGIGLVAAAAIAKRRARRAVA